MRDTVKGERRAFTKDVFVSSAILASFALIAFGVTITPLGAIEVGENDNIPDHVTENGNSDENGGSDENEEEITIIAHKIVCEDSSELPNEALQSGWDGGEIDADTANIWVHDNASCDFADDWYFEWAPSNAENPGDNAIGPTNSDDFTQFGPTVDGKTETQIDISEDTGELWFREVFQEGYLPFSGDTSPQEEQDSAEFYCHRDVLNYDNWEFIDDLQAGNAYHCVAWNVPEKEDEDEAFLTVKKEVNDGDVSQEFNFVLDQFDGKTFLELGTTSLTHDESYTFELPESGEYSLTETTREGWELVDISCESNGEPIEFGNGGETATVSVENGQEVTCTFTNEEEPEEKPERNSISGVKFHDVDRNGSWGEEPTLEDWTIALYKQTDGGPWLTATTTTNAQGSYEFTDLEDGFYHVCEESRGGWEQSYPIEGEEDVVECSDEDTRGHLVKVGHNESRTGINFGNFQAGSSITVTKEVAQGDETQNFEFSLDEFYGKSSTNIGTTTLSHGEEYTFEDLTPGPYLLREENIPEEWELMDISCDPEPEEYLDTPLGEGREGIMRFPFEDETSVFVPVTEDGQEVTCTFTNEGEEIEEEEEETTTTRRSSGTGGFEPLEVLNERVEVIDEDSGSAVIAWETNRSAFSRVVYGPDAGVPYSFKESSSPYFGYPSNTPSSNDRSRSHAFTITDLTPGETYRFRVVSWASPFAFSEEHTFTVPEAEPEDDVEEDAVTEEPIALLDEDDTTPPETAPIEEDEEEVTEEPITEEEDTDEEELLEEDPIEEEEETETVTEDEEDEFDSPAGAAAFMGISAESGFWTCITLALFFFVALSLLYLVFSRLTGKEGNEWYSIWIGATSAVTALVLYFTPLLCASPWLVIIALAAILAVKTTSKSKESAMRG